MARTTKKKVTTKQASKKTSTRRAPMNVFKGVETVGQFFAWYRARTGLTQRDLAAKIGCTGAYVAQIEMDTYKMPYSVCKALATHLSKPERDKLSEVLRANFTLEPVQSVAN